MARNRTRDQKRLAALRRQLENSSPTRSDGFRIRFEGAKVPKDVEAAPTILYDGMSLPVRAVKLDLTKTVIVTILAVFLQLALNIYLQRGGWQLIKSLLRI